MYVCVLVGPACLPRGWAGGWVWTGPPCGFRWASMQPAWLSRSPPTSLHLWLPRWPRQRLAGARCTHSEPHRATARAIPVPVQPRSLGGVGTWEPCAVPPTTAFGAPGFCLLVAMPLAAKGPAREPCWCWQSLGALHCRGTC